MLKSHDRFYSEDGKRLVLIVEDEPVNRALLSVYLEDEYDVLEAEDGVQALEIIRENQSLLSLVILDLMMPKMSGQEVLEIMQGSDELRRIPVIVLTSDEDAEVPSLQQGAADFIKKPLEKPIKKSHYKSHHKII